MVCYARPASLLAAIVAVAWLVFSGPVSHFNALSVEDGRAPGFS